MNRSVGSDTYKAKRPAAKRCFVRFGMPLLVFAPFLVIAGRALAYQGHVYLRSDFALTDIQVHRAMRWQELVGVYDRFGWHHPGPFYLYLVALFEDVVGRSHGAQAQIITAACITGLSLAGIVYVIGRLRGSVGAAAAVLAMVVTAVAVIPHQSPLGDAWTPYVVVMPVALIGVLCMAASLGSGTALAAAILVSSFTIQTDVSTAPVTCAFLVVASIAFVQRLQRMRERPGSEAVPTTWLSRLPALVLIAAAGASWIPPLVQEFTSAPGNLTVLIHFFLHQSHAHAGLSMSAASTGWAEGVVLGLTAPLLVTSKTVGFLLILGVAAMTAFIVAGSVRRRDTLALAGGTALGLGTAVTVVAGADIVAPLWSYFLIWSAGVAAIGLLALMVLVSRWSVDRLKGSRRRLLVGAWSVAAVAGVVGLSVWVVTQPSPASTSDRADSSLVRVIAPVVERDPHARVGVSGVGPGYVGLVSGVTDELDTLAIPFSVPKALLNLYDPTNVRPAAQWVVLVERPYLIPAGYHRIGEADSILVGYTRTPPQPFKDFPRGPTVRQLEFREMPAVGHLVIGGDPGRLMYRSGPSGRLRDVRPGPVADPLGIAWRDRPVHFR
jgi:hypothetical protein